MKVIFKSEFEGNIKVIIVNKIQTKKQELPIIREFLTPKL